MIHARVLGHIRQRLDPGTCQGTEDRLGDRPWEGARVPRVPGVGADERDLHAQAELAPPLLEPP